MNSEGTLPNLLSVAPKLRRRGWWPRPRRLKKLLHLSENLPTSGNELEVFFSGRQLYDRMVRDLRHAKIRIHLEMYMFLADRTGWRFAHELARKARTGVPVRLIYDSVGCFGVSARLFDFLAEAGVELIEYHPIAPWRKRFALFGRNHRKNIIIDGKIGYTGGMNLGDHWLEQSRGGPTWRDTHARIAGPAAGDLEVLFAESWHRQTGELLEIERTVPRESTRKLSRTPGQACQIYVIGGRGMLERRIRKLYLTALGRARRSIEITCPYLVPDPKLRRALRKTARRGVRVALLLPDRSDVRIVDHASRSFFDGYLRQGIEIYLYRRSILHAKTAVIDGHGSTIGTSNLDSLSLHQNLECNLLIEDPAVGELLTRRFERDLRVSHRIHLDEWRRRPWINRLKERLCVLLRPWL